MEPLPLSDEDTLVLSFLRHKYGPTPKKPRANDPMTNGKAGIFWSFDPGRSREAYTAGNTPKKLKRDTKIGFIVPSNGMEIIFIMSSVSIADAAALPPGLNPNA
jgi:hypothetical protein